jgi:hypothetical protein
MQERLAREAERCTVLESKIAAKEEEIVGLRVRLGASQTEVAAAIELERLKAQVAVETLRRELEWRELVWRKQVEAAEARSSGETAERLQATKTLRFLQQQLQEKDADLERALASTLKRKSPASTGALNALFAQEVKELDSQIELARREQARHERALRETGTTLQLSSLLTLGGQQTRIARGEGEGEREGEREREGGEGEGQRPRKDAPGSPKPRAAPAVPTGPTPRASPKAQFTSSNVADEFWSDLESKSEAKRAQQQRSLPQVAKESLVARGNPPKRRDSYAAQAHSRFPPVQRGKQRASKTEPKAGGLPRWR